MEYFRVYYKKGHRLIRADDLEHAERICNERFKTWTDIKRVVHNKPKKKQTFDYVVSGQYTEREIMELYGNGGD